MTPTPKPLPFPVNIPLCVDLDGTLIQEDTSRTAAKRYAGWNPFKWLYIACWFIKGRHAYMKQKIAAQVTLTPKDWTFVPGILDILETERQIGRPLYLVSATWISFAKAVAKDPRCKGYFSAAHVVATKDNINLRAHAKANYLVNAFGEKGFIYAGNSVDDLAVWEKSLHAIMVRPQEENTNLLSQLKKIHPQCLEVVF